MRIRRRLRAAALVALLLGGLAGAVPAAADPSGAPTITHVQPGDGWVRVDWQPADGFAGVPSVVTASPGGQTCASDDYMPYWCIIKDLPDGTPVTVTVTTTGTDGTTVTSAPSAPATPMVDHTAPVLESFSFSPDPVASAGDAVTVTLHITDSGSGLEDGSGTVWLESAQYGNDPVTDPVHLERVAGDANDGTYQAIVPTPAGRPDSVLWVRSSPLRDRIGNSTSDDRILDRVVVGHPFMPTDVTAVQVGRTVHVSWTPPATPGATITGYAVRSTTLRSGYEPFLSTTAPADATSADLPMPDDLTPRSSAFEVVPDGTTKAGPAHPITGTTALLALTATAPDPPHLDASTALGPIVVGMGTPHDHGSPASFRATLRPGGATCALATEGQCTFDGVHGAPYSVAVTATNAAGTSTATTVTGLRPYGPPTAPTAVHLAGWGATGMRVTWRPGHGDGRPVTALVRLVPPSGPAVEVAVGGTATSAVVPSAHSGDYSVRPGVTYSATVTTESGALHSSATRASEHLSVPDGTILPPRMGAPQVDGIGAGRATVRWAGAAVRGGLPVTGYLVRIWDGRTLVRATTRPAWARADREQGLAAGHAYSARVIAINRAGWSPTSAATTFSVPRA